MMNSWERSAHWSEGGLAVRESKGYVRNVMVTWERGRGFWDTQGELRELSFERPFSRSNLCGVSAAEHKAGTGLHESQVRSWSH